MEREHELIAQRHRRCRCARRRQIAANSIQSFLQWFLVSGFHSSVASAPFDARIMKLIAIVGARVCSTVCQQLKMGVHLEFFPEFLALLQFEAIPEDEENAVCIANDVADVIGCRYKLYSSARDKHTFSFVSKRYLLRRLSHSWLRVLCYCLNIIFFGHPP